MVLGRAFELVRRRLFRELERRLSIHQRPLPRHPTEHLPGSPGKVEEMRRRYLRGEHVHHPADATFDDVVGDDRYRDRHPARPSRTYL